MKNDALITGLGLYYSTHAGPSNAGNRTDGKICTAKSGECRHNPKYYTMGMRDAKSWSDPCADDTCPSTCPRLSETCRETDTQKERQECANSMLKDLLT